jgi:hypothetical protein
MMQQLASTIADFNMQRFLQLLETRTEQIDEQLLDMLMSFSNFEQFKHLMTDYKSYYE